MTGITFSGKFDYGGAGIWLVLALVLIPALLWVWFVLDPIDFPLNNIPRGPTPEVLVDIMLATPILGPLASLFWWTYFLGFPELFGYLPMEKTGWRRHLKYYVLTPFVLLLGLFIYSGAI
jgi:hypothetical protein